LGREIHSHLFRRPIEGGRQSPEKHRFCGDFLTTELQTRSADVNFLAVPQNDSIVCHSRQTKRSVIALLSNIRLVSIRKILYKISQIYIVLIQNMIVPPPRFGIDALAPGPHIERCERMRKDHICRDGMISDSRSFALRGGGWRNCSRSLCCGASDRLRAR
jgi:hypothetical protein